MVLIRDNGKDYSVLDESGNVIYTEMWLENCCAWCESKGLEYDFTWTHWKTEDGDGH